jgi:hypothetical protein
VFYAEGVQDFTQRLRVLARHPLYLFADLDYSDRLQRSAVVSEISFGWLRHFTRLLDLHPETPDLDVQAYLSEVLLKNAD